MKSVSPSRSVGARMLKPSAAPASNHSAACRDVGGRADQHEMAARRADPADQLAHRQAFAQRQIVEQPAAGFASLR
ncbi:hypothetical protein [Novosphingobium sp. NBM11]|uniref:hypothetical protein n=1 Tax=Novosphingobium sp. NBM11 TaxID=2596914 RepID=UPI002107ED58|nr:hypothetical protein [Novosphingobium sp. NBM11]